MESDLIHSAFKIVSKRLVQPLYHINFIWNLTELAERMRDYNRFARDLFQKVCFQRKMVIFIEAVHQNLKFYINTFYSLQLIEGKLNADLECVSVLEKLLTVSKENPSFTLEHVFIETGTILIGVSNSINFNESIYNRFSLSQRFYYF